MSTDAQKRASSKYDKANAVIVTLKLNRKTDADIIEYLEACGNKQGEIKRVIRKEIENK